MSSIWRRHALTVWTFYLALEKPADKPTICHALGIQDRHRCDANTLRRPGWLQKENEVFRLTEMAGEFLVRFALNLGLIMPR